MWYLNCLFSLPLMPSPYRKADIVVSNPPPRTCSVDFI